MTHIERFHRNVKSRFSISLRQTWTLMWAFVLWWENLDNQTLAYLKTNRGHKRVTLKYMIASILRARKSTGIISSMLCLPCVCRPTTQISQSSVGFRGNNVVVFLTNVKLCIYYKCICITVQKAVRIRIYMTSDPSTLIDLNVHKSDIPKPAMTCVMTSIFHFRAATFTFLPLLVWLSLISRDVLASGYRDFQLRHNCSHEISFSEICPT